MNIQEIVKKVKQKPELSGISDFVVSRIVDEAIKKDLQINDINSLHKKDIKEIVAISRSKLRKYSGRFSSSDQHIIYKHISTKERMPYYPEIKSKLSFLKYKSILDLGCGINPLEFANKSVKYYAYDINESSLEVVREYFKKNNISGEVKIFDFTKQDFSLLPKVDLCILFKVLDLIDARGHKKAEELIKSLKCKYILASFPTKTLSGKPMNHPQRGWIERLLGRLEMNYEFFTTKNEIFYLIKK